MIFFNKICDLFSKTKMCSETSLNYNLTFCDKFGYMKDTEIINIIENVTNNLKCYCQIYDVERNILSYRYFLKPLIFFNLSKITQLEKNLKFWLNEVKVEFERGIIIIEIPNAPHGIKNILPFGNCLGKEKTLKNFGTNIFIGMLMNGENFSLDITKAPHILIAGTTGSGKSIFLHTVLCQLIIQNSENDLKIFLIDTKKVESSFYKPLKKIIEIVSTSEEALILLERMEQEMRYRYTFLESKNCRDIDAYNQTFSKRKLQKIIIVIDELADLVLSDKRVTKILQSLSQLGRASGIHLILATQRPVVKIVDGIVKANIDTRICFNVPSVRDSMTILDRKGAEQLKGKGDMLLKTSADVNFQHLQGYFLYNTDIQNIVEVSRKLKK